jgi:hypothetical protein
MWGGENGEANLRGEDSTRQFEGLTLPCTVLFRHMIGRRTEAFPTLEKSDVSPGKFQFSSDPRSLRGVLAPSACDSSCTCRADQRNGTHHPESGQRTGPKLEIRAMCSRWNPPKRLHMGNSDDKPQATVSTALTVPWPWMGAGSSTLARGQRPKRGGGLRDLMPLIGSQVQGDSSPHSAAIRLQAARYLTQKTLSLIFTSELAMCDRFPKSACSQCMHCLSCFSRHMQIRGSACFE